MEDLNSRIADLEFQLRREQLENRKSIKEILYSILDVYDGLQKLLKISEKQNWPQEAQNFVKNRFSLVGQRLLQTLERSGAIQINSLGQPLNCEYHETLREVFNLDIPEGNIMEVEQEGYIYEGEVLRMAKVVVATSQRER